MYAVIRSGSKQYRVAPGDNVKVETLPGKVGGEMIFTDPAIQNWFKVEAKWLEWTFEAICAASVLLLSTWIKSRHPKES